MRQQPQAELLDEDAGTPAEIARSLEELWWINRRLGGCSSWRKLLPRLPAAASVLDVGSGYGDMAQFVGAALGARVIMLDRMPSHLGRRGPRVSADALRLPFADGSFDLVTCNLFLHHFHGRQAQLLLDEMARVARRAVVINDLERGWVPWLAMKLLSPRFSRLVRYDGPVSVRQAYTAPELDRLAAARPHTVVRMFPWRLGLILWKNHAV